MQCSFLFCYARNRPGLGRGVRFNTSGKLKPEPFARIEEFYRAIGARLTLTWNVKHVQQFRGRNSTVTVVIYPVCNFPGSRVYIGIIIVTIARFDRPTIFVGIIVGPCRSVMVRANWRTGGGQEQQQKYEESEYRNYRSW